MAGQPRGRRPGSQSNAEWLRGPARDSAAEDMRSLSRFDIQERYPELSSHQAQIIVALVAGTRTHHRVSTLHIQVWDEVRATAGGGELPETPRQAAVKMEQTATGAKVVAHLAPLQTLDDVLQACAIDTDRWAPIHHKVKPYQQAQKGPDGEPIIVQLFSHEVRLEPRLVPRRAEPLAVQVVARPEPRKAPSRDGTVILVVPDKQIGYKRVGGRLEPYHDRRVLDLAAQVIRLASPDLVAHLGDDLDMAPVSTKFARASDTMDTTWTSMQEQLWWLGQYDAMMPSPDLLPPDVPVQVWMEGNHDARIRKAMLEKMPELASLPGLRIENLIDLASVRCEYVGDYPSTYWARDDARIIHGDVVKQHGGETAAEYLRKKEVSTAFGHIHRREIASRTVHGARGAREITAFSPGCACHIDGRVPGSPPDPNWQQGLALWHLNDDGTQYVEMLPIHEGAMPFRGSMLYAEDRTEDVATALNLQGILLP